MRILAMGNCPLDPHLGSGRSRLRWSEGLRELGHQVEVWQPSDFIQSWGTHRAQKLRMALGAWKKLKRTDWRSYDLIEFYGDEFWLAQTWLLKQKDRPLMVAHTDGLELIAAERKKAWERHPSFHRTFGKRVMEFLYEASYGRVSVLAFRHADCFVAGSEVDREFVLNLGLFKRERTAVVSLGLEPVFLAPASIGERRDEVVFLGGWLEGKGLRHLVPVMTRVLQKREPTRFLLLGTGRNSEPRVRERFPAELQERIVVKEHLKPEEIAAELDGSKVFFFPTVSEGFGLALAEAMARGCAAVTTPTGFGAGLRRGEELLICDFEDEDAMEKALLRLLEDEEFRLKIARNGRRRVEELNWPEQTRRLEKYFLNWLKEKGKDHG